MHISLKYTKHEMCSRIPDNEEREGKREKGGRGERERVKRNKGGSST